MQRMSQFEPRASSDAVARPLHVVLSVDPTPHTLAAARFVRDLLLPQGSLVTALAVDDPDRSVNLGATLKALDRVVSIMDYNHIEVMTSLMEGHEAELLLTFSRRLAADLLMVSANGLHNRFGIFLGGPAQRLVNAAHCPVLIARAPYVRLRHVLVVSDFTWTSLNAARYLAEMPLPPNTRYTVMYVQSHEDGALDLLGRTRYQNGAGARSGEPDVEVELRATEQCVSAVVPSYPTEVLRAAGRCVTSIVVQGDSVAEVIHYAQTHGVDLIVTGANAQGTAGSWFTGDATRRLVHNAYCSVLVVKRAPSKVCGEC